MFFNDWLSLCGLYYQISNSVTTDTAASNVSQSTSNTISTSSGGSTVSRNSQFSARSGDETCPDGQILPNANLRIFSYLELKSATRNFRSDTVLGEGGFGKVYKGWLEERPATKPGRNTVIAVKKLNSESLQGFEEWQVILFCLMEKNIICNVHFVLYDLLGRSRTLNFSPRTSSPMSHSLSN